MITQGFCWKSYQAPSVDCVSYLVARVVLGVPDSRSLNFLALPSLPADLDTHEVINMCTMTMMRVTLHTGCIFFYFELLVGHGCFHTEHQYHTVAKRPFRLLYWFFPPNFCTVHNITSANHSGWPELRRVSLTTETSATVAGRLIIRVSQHQALQCMKTSSIISLKDNV